MNLQCTAPKKPLRVFILNALLPSSQMLAEKILSGAVFGQDQKINLLFLVHDDELKAVEALKIELENCGYGCTNYIQYTMEFPRLEDADVFCFMTALANPNCVNFQDIQENEKDHAALRFLMTVGNNIANVPIIVEKKSDEPILPAVKKKEIEDRCKHEPLFVTDGLVTMNILHQCCKDVPYQLFFCSTPLENITKMVLGDYLKVLCNKINHTLIWAASDEVFHIEVLKPVIMDEKLPDTACDREVISKNVMDILNMDHTQFSSSWMKKEFIERVKLVAMKNPYGPVYKASAFANTLKTIWASKRGNRTKTMYANIGVISNGACETVKGGPYILPLVLKGGCWSLNKSFEADCFVRHEINRINKTVRQNIETVKDYCRVFLAPDESSTSSSSSRTYSCSTTFSSQS